VNNLLQMKWDAALIEGHRSDRLLIHTVMRVIKEPYDCEKDKFYQYLLDKLDGLKRKPSMGDLINRSTVRRFVGNHSWHLAGVLFSDAHGADILESMDNFKWRERKVKSSKKRPYSVTSNIRLRDLSKGSDWVTVK